jgi:hypothetical protein
MSEQVFRPPPSLSGPLRLPLDPFMMTDPEYP